MHSMRSLLLGILLLFSWTASASAAMLRNAAAPSLLQAVDSMALAEEAEEEGDAPAAAPGIQDGAAAAPPEDGYTVVNTVVASGQASAALEDPSLEELPPASSTAVEEGYSVVSSASPVMSADVPAGPPRLPAEQPVVVPPPPSSLRASAPVVPALATARLGPSGVPLASAGTAHAGAAAALSAPAAPRAAPVASRAAVQQADSRSGAGGATGVDAVGVAPYRSIGDSSEGGEVDGPLAFEVRNVDFVRVRADPSLRRAITEAIDRELAAGTARGAWHVQLTSALSRDVLAVADGPALGLPAAAADSLAERLASAVADVDGIAAASKGAISVALVRRPAGFAPAVLQAVAKVGANATSSAGSAATGELGCFPGCLDGQGVCAAGVCFCKTLFVGQQCEKKVETMRLSQVSLVGMTSGAVALGAVSGFLVHQVREARKLALAAAGGTDRLHLAEVWRPTSPK